MVDAASFYVTRRAAKPPNSTETPTIGNPFAALRENWAKGKWLSPFMPERRRLLSRDGINYICYNASHVPPPPIEPDGYGEYIHISPHKLLVPHWLNSRHPFLGHAPQYIRRSGLLRSLYDPCKSAIIERVEGGKHRLQQSISSNWQNVETSMVTV